MVNFLRFDEPVRCRPDCDPVQCREHTEPPLVIRVIAFDADSGSSYSFDLTYDDLNLFVEGNVKLLTVECQHDLCMMILHNIVRIKNRV